MQMNTILSFRHLCGSKKIPLSIDEALVICQVKNGAMFVDDFVRHHIGMGFKHIIFVDNGSTDGTIKKACAYDKVSVIQSKLKHSQYQCQLRRYAAKKFGQHKWCLVIDIDEFFDYPGSNEVSLQCFLQYLNANSYTAVMGQMLDMFSDKPLDETSAVEKGFINEFRYYDISNIDKYEYDDFTNIGIPYYLENNTSNNKEVKYYFGGIRKTVFGTNNCLTKYSLIRLTDHLLPVTHVHCSSNANCADITVLLKHYKFAGDFYNNVRKSVENRTFVHQEDNAYLKKMNDGNSLRFIQATSQEFTCTENLVREGFIVSSPEFDQWCSKYSTIVKNSAI